MTFFINFFQEVILGTNRYVFDLSNKVLNIDFGQRDAKISDLKVGGRKKYLPTQPGLTPTHLGPAETVDIFSDL